MIHSFLFCHLCPVPAHQKEWSKAITVSTPLLGWSGQGWIEYVWGGYGFWGHPLPVCCHFPSKWSNSRTSLILGFCGGKGFHSTGYSHQKSNLKKICVNIPALWSMSRSITILAAALSALFKFFILDRPERLQQENRNYSRQFDTFRVITIQQVHPLFTGTTKSLH